MKVVAYLLVSGLLLSHHAPVVTPFYSSATRQLSVPEAEFNHIGNDIMRLVQRALGLPSDATAVALLQKEGAPLRQQARKLRPTYAQWFSGLNAREKTGVRERIQLSSFGGYFGSLETDVQLAARLHANPRLSQAVDQLTAALNMVH